MFDIRAETRINRPIEEVFAFVADSRNDPKWAVPVLECVQVVGDGPEKGAQYTFASKMPVGKARGKMEIVVYEPPQLIEWQIRSSINTSHARFSFESEEGATVLSARSTLQASGIFVLTESRMEREINRSYQQQFQNLKQLLESRSG